MFLNHFGELRGTQRKRLRQVFPESNTLWIIFREHSWSLLWLFTGNEPNTWPIPACAAACILCDIIFLFTATSASLLLRETDLSILKCNYSRAKSLSNERTLKREKIEERSEISCESPGWWDCPVFLSSRPHSTSTDWLVVLQCSVTCGAGSRRRAVICSGGRSKCDPKSRPEDISQCNTGDCPEWKAGEWSKVVVLQFLPSLAISHLCFWISTVNQNTP